MKPAEVLIIGGGPAGLCAAISAAELGCKVLLVDRNKKLGGQLVKQTHMFFGSEKQYASIRGIDIADLLLDKIENNKNVEILSDTTILGIYEDGVVTADQSGKYFKIKPDAIVVATGASEKTLAFPYNDLPGVYGAGAVQTLMNEYGVKPGNRVIMLGAGNIGLIVSYQLMQAGVEVAAVVDASPKIGGYLVHASKIRRMGVPIFTGHTVKEAYGSKALEGVTVWQLDDKWNAIEGSEKHFDVDVMCIAVGLTPLSELLWQAGCEMKYVNELGGFVPVRNEDLETSVKGIFVAGDVSGVEEASSAMVEGYLAGLSAANYLGYTLYNINERKQDLHQQLDALRSGPVGEKIRKGISELVYKSEAAVSEEV
ncbi:NAD(P)/FAD-dependent oxidoreductase [Geosporobacter ferrireducens]|uniref:Pyridine nucleotide-disulfide oxidoreductase n=1 Tax=Geosporobacter ferrireducens TaxID=1424294 RepID=A0A1D8GBB9_9FIRM|nr:NAD(P)/FAD-dependent oxidoreductase [Geosporobacter ferrireducens]AOT68209.1 pyridine nucleotide-disulfide oxidoreductase [Geosporobacter ferrireducens]MTI54260.1 FAD-dependent oxidoreductase [Geosporobacter ferrireducens]